MCRTYLITAISFLLISCSGGEEASMEQTEKPTGQFTEPTVVADVAFTNGKF